MAMVQIMINFKSTNKKVTQSIINHSLFMAVKHIHHEI